MKRKLQVAVILVLCLFCAVSFSACGENAFPNKVEYNADRSLFCHTTCSTVAFHKQGWNFEIEDESIIQYDVDSGSAEVLSDSFLCFERRIRRETFVFKPISEGSTKITFKYNNISLSKRKYVFDVAVTKDESGDFIIEVDK